MTTPTLETMQKFTFGVEIETINMNRESLARVVAETTGGTASYVGNREGYDKWIVTLADGRKWACMSDASVTGGRHGANGEVVTPICTYADLTMIQDVCRALHKAGARTDLSCGIHVHVGVSALAGQPGDLDGMKAIGRLAKLVYQQEPLIFAALGVQARRIGQYCRPVDENIMTRFVRQRPVTREAAARAWYNGQESYAVNEHYHGSRYHGLNLHSVFFRGTVEFRYFEATLHAGKVKTYVQFCLALAAKALTSKAAVARKRDHNPATAKYDFRVFLLRLGMIGKEFETARLHLLANMKGSSSWKNGRPEAPAAPDSTPAPAPPESA